MSHHELSPPAPTPEQFRAAQQSPEFTELRRTYRSFAFPMTVAFFVWYLLFVIVGAFFPQVMAIRLFGYINLGLVLGLLQFVTTFVITGAYVRFANRTLDPKSTALRERLEREAAGGSTLETPEAAR